MKTTRLLACILLVAATVSTASAQRRSHNARDEYRPTVYMVSMQEIDTIYNGGCCAAQQMQQGMMLRNLAKQQAVADYTDTHRTGFQQAGKPMFIFTTNNNKFSLALGGEINLRASYEFDGLVDNVDFVPYDIPVPGSYASRQKIYMDASTSRLYLKAIVNSSKLGRVIIFVDGDFRGGNGRNYTPRVRSAFVSLGGFTFGRDVTTFCDLDAAPTTIDFRGPNAYNFRFTQMIRYEIPFANNHLKLGMAAELPSVSGTYGADGRFAALPQRVPDFPVYFQVAWGRERQSHIRASAVFRDMYMYNVNKNSSTDLFGWGVQASGRIAIWRILDLYFNGVYGEGITPYIQDLTGSGMDFAPNPNNPGELQATPMYAWQAAARINLLRNLSISGGYSEAVVRHGNGFFTGDAYRRGQYIFGNIFYSVTPHFTLAAEYLYGARKNMNGNKNHANRVNVQVQYRF